jgi:hypothetical protein
MEMEPPLQPMQPTPQPQEQKAQEQTFQQQDLLSPIARMSVA